MSDADYREALVAISSLAGVAWAGGLIALTLKPKEYRVQGLLDTASWAAVISLGGLVFPPASLRWFALIPVLPMIYYSVETIWGIIRDKPQVVRTEEQAKEAIAIRIGFIWVAIYQLAVPATLIAIWLQPTFERIAIATFILLFASYRRIAVALLG